MGKITAYVCDVCNFLTQNPDEIFALNGYFLNGESKTLGMFSSDKFYCLNCLIESFQKTQPEQIKFTEHDFNEDPEGTDDLLNKILKRDHESQKESTIEEIIHDKIEEQNINQEEESEIKTDYDYIQLFHIADEDNQTKIINQLGYSSLQEFTKETGFFTLLNTFIPLDDGINEEQFEALKNNFQVKSQPVMNLNNNIPKVKIVDVYTNQDNSMCFVKVDNLIETFDENE